MQVRASHGGLAYRVLFATEGRWSHVLLALEAFDKRTERTPPHVIDTALARLADWRARAARRR